eukprot:TRINITY_DN7423_c0_g1_i1.p1 TRINITY_DN7423_c0_g1~~TRINITY_DN7423_c0_g1_i1.p1  ORF type:complete len:473 (+),score=142.48 TRINITY_DN7423_c0_g1_i1:37-1455(+)
MSVLEQLGEPKTVWERFLEICSIPHPSDHTEKIAEYIRSFGEKKGYFSEIDGSLNVRIVVEATNDQLPCIVLQSHIDMVPNSVDPSFDFVNQPITPVVDGDNLTAEGTTLGADNGIGMASMLAFLDHLPEKHGKFIFIFTNDEEVSLNGALTLDPSWVEGGNYVLNLDEEDGGICLGSAGGATTIAEFDANFEKHNETVYYLKISGGLEGHSGVCIHLPRHNINKVWSRVFEELDFRMCGVKVGMADNIIPGVGEWWFTSAMDPTELASHIATKLEDIADEIPEDSKLVFELEEVDNKPRWSLEAHNNFLKYMKFVPHGVKGFVDILGLKTVETSLNIGGIVSVEKDKIRIVTSVRSTNEAQLSDLIDEIVKITDGVAFATDRYPAWDPTPDSNLVKYACEVFEEMGKEPEIYAIHAGLESSILLSKNPKMEGISIGPIIKDCHTPGEYVNIESVRTFWELLSKTIAKLNSL